MTMTAQARAERLAQLYRLRRQVDTEIGALEAQVANEAAALARIREWSKAIGTPEPRRRVAQCGTDSGYYHHRRVTRTQPCTACRTAHSLAERTRAQRRQESVAPMLFDGYQDGKSEWASQ